MGKEQVIRPMLGLKMRILFDWHARTRDRLPLSRRQLDGGGDVRPEEETQRRAFGVQRGGTLALREAFAQILAHPFVGMQVQLSGLLHLIGRLGPVHEGQNMLLIDLAGGMRMYFAGRNAPAFLRRAFAQRVFGLMPTLVDRHQAIEPTEDKVSKTGTTSHGRDPFSSTRPAGWRTPYRERTENNDSGKGIPARARSPPDAPPTHL